MATLPGLSPILIVVFFAHVLLAAALGSPAPPPQSILRASGRNNGPASPASVSVSLFRELEELARIVDIAYCVGTAGLGIQKPFQCASRCSEFPNFDLVTTWNTGPLLSDSCGYIAISHPPSPPRIILAFRGTYSIANTIVDLSTIPQEYVPYPGDDDDSAPSDFMAPKVTLTDATHDTPPPADPPKCDNCTVHTGFYSSWLHTRKAILPHVTEAIDKYPGYQLTLVGHSLGGAVAALAGLDFLARGWDPHVTTFGEPRVGNRELMSYLNARFNITSDNDANKFHRVTHVDDPVPLLPLAEWGYSMHSQEIYISAPDLPPSLEDVHYCDGDQDPNCIAGPDSNGLSWGLPARFKFWQLFFAHRDYFWRLGLCVSGGNPKDWYRKYPNASANANAVLDDTETNQSDEL